jgi:hypothetical protein
LQTEALQQVLPRLKFHWNFPGTKKPAGRVQNQRLREVIIQPLPIQNSQRHQVQRQFIQQAMESLWGQR